MSDELMELVKTELKVTWDDERTNREIGGIVEDAAAALAFKIGMREETPDFSTAGQERRLFLAYCRYLWNDCEDEFDNAYLSDILQLRRKYEVKYGKEDGDI